MATDLEEAWAAVRKAQAAHKATGAALRLARARLTLVQERGKAQQGAEQRLENERAKRAAERGIPYWQLVQEEEKESED